MIYSIENIKIPPDIPPTINGHIPINDLYIPPVIVPMIIFFVVDDNYDISSSNKKFIE